MAANLLETGHGSLGNRIFHVLREKILNEEYLPGQKLNEVALAREMNISRTPIREALKQLELEGLVKSIPNKGVFVLGFSAQDIDDMFKIRLALESLGIQIAIERMTPEYMEKITEAYELLEFYYQKDDLKKYNECNLKFHDAIYQTTQSQYFEHMINDINYYISVSSRHSMKQPKRINSAATEHKNIYDAIVAGDKEAAKEAIETHIESSRLLVVEYFNNQQKMKG